LFVFGFVRFRVCSFSGLFVFGFFRFRVLSFRVGGSHSLQPALSEDSRPYRVCLREAAEATEAT
jgi:hypothetical protein